MKEKLAKKRNMRPREQVAVMPPSFSLDTCEVVAGLKPRRMRDLVKAWRIPHVSVGHLLVVRTSDWLDALEQHASNTNEDSASIHEDACESVDAVLASLGVERVTQ